MRGYCLIVNLSLIHQGRLHDGGVSVIEGQKVKCEGQMAKETARKKGGGLGVSEVKGK